MNEGLEPEFSERKIIPYDKSLQNISNPSSDLEYSDLEVIAQVLAEKTRKAESPQEFEKFVKILPRIEETKSIRTRNYLDVVKIEEARIQAEFNRKMAERKELVKIGASVAAVGIGVYLMPTAPLFAPFVIVLGIASPLQYSLREVANLWERMINSTENAASKLLPPDETVSDKPNNDPGELSTY
jgi:hypothetical protein